MGKKRISDDSTESNPPVKIPKVTEFSGTTFKTMLKEPSSAMNGEFKRSRCRYYDNHGSYLQLFLHVFKVSLSICLGLCISLCVFAAGLKSFVSAAKKLPSSDVYDVVEGYIKISMECTEIFKLLEGEKHVEAEVI